MSKKSKSHKSRKSHKSNKTKKTAKSSRSDYAASFSNAPSRSEDRGPHYLDANDKNLSEADRQTLAYLQSPAGQAEIAYVEQAQRQAAFQATLASGSFGGRFIG